jgi:hypothetical protein
MKWRKVSGVAGVTYFSEDGQWAIHTIEPGKHRLCQKQRPVGEFRTVRLAKQAAEAGTLEI